MDHLLPTRELPFLPKVQSLEPPIGPMGLLCISLLSGADPGFRRGGGVRTFRRGGFVQEFQERIQIVAGPWANQQAKQNCRQPGGGGGSDDPKKTPVSAHAYTGLEQ